MSTPPPFAFSSLLRLGLCQLWQRAYKPKLEAYVFSDVISFKVGESLYIQLKRVRFETASSTFLLVKTIYRCFLFDTEYVILLSPHQPYPPFLHPFAFRFCPSGDNDCCIHTVCYFELRSIFPQLSKQLFNILKT